jgi:hypothetical protein
MPKTNSEWLKFVKDYPKNSKGDSYYEQVDNYLKILEVGCEHENITIRIICQRSKVEFAENVSI